MDTVTYPNADVQKMISDNFIPLKLQCNFAKPTDMMRKYHVRWTPTLMVLGSDGNARYHMVGYMPPEELVPELALLRAMEKFDKGDFKTALQQLREVVDKHPNTSAAPQALFYIGVAGYKSTRDPKKLKETHLELKQKYPDNLWAKKSMPYGEIPG
ncbi:MAG: hypothetical protein HY801_09035 [Candidatus Lindowbacteria bacterium]|nr:hypothetical protein [Candidatus Lindowbacteria bacterium]